MKDDHALLDSCRRLEVSPDISATDLERVWMQASFAFVREPDDTKKAELRRAYLLLKEHVVRREAQEAKRKRTDAEDRKTEADQEALIEAWAYDEPLSIWDLRSFDSPVIAASAAPLVVGLAWLINHSPMRFLLQGFQVWVHEFGHATVAWMSGYKALPLPFGWTNIEFVKQEFVYAGGLILLAVFFVAGWKERRLAPLVLAPVLAGFQAWMTWKVPDGQTELWIDFAGVGGEFYLSAMMMGLFFVPLTEKFRWGVCRYVFLFLGAACLLHVTTFWHDVARGVEEIPWGTMINGEEDGGGDMNKLHEDWGWTRAQITHRYNALGGGCVLALGAAYVLANLRALWVWWRDR